MGTIILRKKDMLSRAELRNAFNEVDTDGSDSIELGELANLCGKVSVADFDQANATELFKEIDTNHDGKISFDEFTAWDRLGRNSKLRDVLKYQLKALNKFDAHFTKTYKKCSAYDGEGRTSFIDVELRDGEPSENNTDCCVRLTTKADEVLGDRVGEGHNSELPAGTRAFACFTIRSTNPTALAQAFRDFYNSAKDLLIEKEPEMEGLFGMVKYHVGTDEDWVVVASDAAGNPFLEQFIFMGLQGMDFADMAQPELVYRITTDCTWESIRTADDMLNMVDNTRFRFEVSANTAGKKQLLDILNQSVPDLDSRSKMNVSAVRLFNGFTFKAKSNSKEQAGGLNQNFQQMLTALKELGHPSLSAQTFIMEAMNESPYKTWSACMQAVKDNSGDSKVEDVRRELNNYPFVRDFLDAFRAHAVADMKSSVFVNNYQACFCSKTKGFGQCFNEVWEALKL